MARYQINCIRTDTNAHGETTTLFGGPDPHGCNNWKDRIENVIASIKNGEHQFWARIDGRIFDFAIGEESASPYSPLMAQDETGTPLDWNDLPRCKL